MEVKDMTVEDLFNQVCSTKHGKKECERFKINGKEYNGAISGEAAIKISKQWAIAKVKARETCGACYYMSILEITNGSATVKCLKKTRGRMGTKKCNHWKPKTLLSDGVREWIMENFNLTKEDLK